MFGKFGVIVKREDGEKNRIIMKKVLFLTFAYPYGHFGPSDNCSVRVMDTLSISGKYEVWDLSYKPQASDSQPNYRIVEGVKHLYLPFPEKRPDYPYILEHLLLFLKIPIYPIFSIRSIRKHYNACKEILRNNDFDLVISQCSPQDSVFTGALLKRDGIIKRHMVLIWDNIYGTLPRRIIPKRFALSRSRKVENWIARYTDRIISPIPVKAFHDQYGDVSRAENKRVYLGHPLIVRPKVNSSSIKKSYIKKGCTNILYAGRLYSVEDLVYAISIINNTACAENINLILFFYRLPSEEEMKRMRMHFRGSICFSGKVPYDELLSIYPEVDMFMGFAGGSAAQVISKIYDYICFGKPVVYFYKDDCDVNVKEFSRYPLFLSVKIQDNTLENREIEQFIMSCNSQTIPFHEVEKFFPEATGMAYVRQVEELID